MKEEAVEAAVWVAADAAAWAAVDGVVGAAAEADKADTHTPGSEGIALLENTPCNGAAPAA